MIVKESDQLIVDGAGHRGMGGGHASGPYRADLGKATLISNLWVDSPSHRRDRAARGRRLGGSASASTGDGPWICLIDLRPNIVRRVICFRAIRGNSSEMMVA